MKTANFQDLSNQDITVQFSGGGDLRVYIKGEQDKTMCLHMNNYQANILINALKDLMEFAE